MILIRFSVIKMIVNNSFGHAFIFSLENINSIHSENCYGINCIDLKRFILFIFVLKVLNRT